MTSEDYILQANELGVNAFTTTKKYQWRCHDSKLVVNFMMSKRMGCTQKMVLDTVANFLHAAKCLWNDEFEAGEKFINRKPYEDETPLHGEARVNIFGDLLVDGGKWIFPVNICNEFTSAENILSFAKTDFANDVNLAAWGCYPVTNGNGKPKPQQPPQTKETREAPPETNTNYQPQQHGDMPLFEHYIGQDRRADIEQRYTGKSVAVRVAGADRTIKEYDDGNEEDRIRFYPPESENAYFAGMRIRLGGRDKYGESAIKKDGVLSKLPETGYKIPLHGVAVYKLNKDKREGFDNIYWNFVGFHFDEPEAEQPILNDDFEPHPGDDIPW